MPILNFCSIYRIERVCKPVKKWIHSIILSYWRMPYKIRVSRSLKSSLSKSVMCINKRIYYNRIHIVYVYISCPITGACKKACKFSMGFCFSLLFLWWIVIFCYCCRCFLALAAARYSALVFVVVPVSARPPRKKATP